MGIKNEELIANDLRSILISTQSAKNLVDDGKEVKCSRKLQGILNKMESLLFFVCSSLEVKKCENSDELVKNDSKKI